MFQKSLREAHSMEFATAKLEQAQKKVMALPNIIKKRVQYDKVGSDENAERESKAVTADVESGETKEIINYDEIPSTCNSTNIQSLTVILISLCIILTLAHIMIPPEEDDPFLHPQEPEDNGIHIEIHYTPQEDYNDDWFHPNKHMLMY